MASQTTSLSSQPQSARSLIPVHGIGSKFLPWKKLDDVAASLSAENSGSVFARLLSTLNVHYEVAERDLGCIPIKGPIIVVANHPFGILDGVIVADLLTHVRPDVKILTNRLLAQIPWLRDHCIFVDPFGTTESAHASRRGLREAIRWLNSDGALIVFPAGEVSHFSFKRPEVVDPAWSNTAARLARKLRVEVLPVYFNGRNSLTFQGLGLAHPRLRTLRLTHEFVSSRNKTVNVRIGSRVAREELARFEKDEDATQYLRWRTYFLRERDQIRKTERPRSLIHHHAIEHLTPVAEPTSDERITAEIDSLDSKSLLCSNGEFDVYVATASEIPCVMHEIGRLREVTFRAVGEGSGRTLDLDEYDEYYKHLFVWDTKQQQLVGAYRFGDTAEILPAKGIPGLYTSSLFKYHQDFFSVMGPALEMGRSFVRQEYQRQYAPLMMLWKGIGAYIASHPESPVLFGAVSMSNDYKVASRELLVSFFQRERKNDAIGLVSMVKPRCPFRGALIPDWETRSALKLLVSANDLNAPISDIEPDSKELPILIKQYLKLGGRILSFNVDRAFSNVLDGLVMVDLRNTRGESLNRYMGVKGARAFLRHHANTKAVISA